MWNYCWISFSSFLQVKTSLIKPGLCWSITPKMTNCGCAGLFHPTCNFQLTAHQLKFSTCLHPPSMSGEHKYWVLLTLIVKAQNCRTILIYWRHAFLEMTITASGGSEYQPHTVNFVIAMKLEWALAGYKRLTIVLIDWIYPINTKFQKPLSFNIYK